MLHDLERRGAHRDAAPERPRTGNRPGVPRPRHKTIPTQTSTWGLTTAATCGGMTHRNDALRAVGTPVSGSTTPRTGSNSSGASPPRRRQSDQSYQPSCGGPLPHPRPRARESGSHLCCQACSPSTSLQVNVPRRAAIRVSSRFSAPGPSRRPQTICSFGGSGGLCWPQSVDTAPP